MLMNEEYYLNLIHKQLGKEISPQEDEELQTWLKGSVENQQVYEQERLLWELSDQSINEYDLEVDLEQEFEALQTRIKASETEEKGKFVTPEKEVKVVDLNSSKKPRKSGGFLQVAAALVILVGLAFALKLGLENDNEFITISALDEIETIILPDSSEVRLNIGSKLSYPKSFSQQERLLSLSGEAFFEVQSDKSKPFIIETTAEKVKVLGTSFNLRAIEGEKHSEVYVLEGVVEFGALNGSAIRLEAKDLGTLNREMGIANKQENQRPNAIAWFNNELHFRDTPLSEVVLALEKLHQVEIQIEQSILNSCKFSGSFLEKDLDRSLKIISLVFDLDIEIQGKGKYILKGQPCT